MLNGLWMSEDGTKHWYKDGKLSRWKKPAVIRSNGEKQWWWEGKLHRKGGPAIVSISYINYVSWWYNGKCHREDGPALIKYKKNESWYQYSKLHREDGPAYFSYDGLNKRYLIDGNEMSEIEFKILKRNKLIEHLGN